MRLFKQKPALHFQIITGLVLGIVWGIISGNVGWSEFNTGWINPFGTIFLNLLKLIAVPLIFVSLITGISNLSDVSNLSRIGFKTFSLYICTTILAITIGLLTVNIIEPGNSFPEDKKAELREKYAETTAKNSEKAIDTNKKTGLQFLTEIVPENIISSASNNSNMLQVIFFSILTGICMILIPTEKSRAAKSFFDSLNEIILKMIDVIMKFAPIGVFALMVGVLNEFSGNNAKETLGLFVALGLYSLSVIIGLAILVLVIYPISARLFGKVKPGHFFKALFPVQLLAFSTSSSAATLAMTMKQSEEQLHIPKSISSFCLPLGATVNMDGTSLYQAVAAVFIAQSMGIELGFSEQLVIILTATLSSIGSAAVPGAGVIMLVIVLNSVGIPNEGIALILAVDRILDMFRTVVNVSGDVLIATIITESERKKQLKTQL
jgi:Na+/H+-dicarboxylate symporter